MYRDQLQYAIFAGERTLPLVFEDVAAGPALFVFHDPPVNKTNLALLLYGFTPAPVGGSE